jgi:hypothetical protein
MQVVAKIISGSRAYGYSTPQSDLDIRGVFVEDFEFVLSGMAPLTRPKDGSGEDEVYYELAHFANLCLKGVPQTIEMLFAPEDCYLDVDPLFMETFMPIRERFLRRSFQSSLSGYCISELKAVMRDSSQGHEALTRAPKRISHVFRLLRMGIQAKETGTITTRAPEAEWLLRVRQTPQEVFGGFTLTEAMEKACVAAKDLLGAFDALPDLPSDESLKADCMKRVAAFRLSLNGTRL